MRWWISTAWRKSKSAVTLKCTTVVNGVPRPRPDHVQALADFAIDMADVAAELEDPHSLAMPMRIGLADGQVITGVTRSRWFFYDVWATRSTSHPEWNPPTR